jgi:hypothetical protein
MIDKISKNTVKREWNKLKRKLGYKEVIASVLDETKESKAIKDFEKAIGID